MRTYLSVGIFLLCLIHSNGIMGQEKLYDVIYDNFILDNVEESILDKPSSNLHLFGSNFNLLSYNRKNMEIGFNAFLEEDLPGNDIGFTDFFVYNFGFKFNMNQFQISLFFENFLNMNNTELSIEPVSVETNRSLVYLEHDTPSLIHLSLVYIF